MKFDFATRDGNILLWQLCSHLRISSRVASAVQMVDFWEGYDEIFDVNPTDRELGERIRTAMDQSRIVSVVGMPRVKPAELRKLHKSWEKKLLDVAGVKKIEEVEPGHFRTVDVIRDASGYFFRTYDGRKSPFEPRQLQEGDDGYKVLFCEKNSSNETIGELGRQALEQFLF